MADFWPDEGITSRSFCVNKMSTPQWDDDRPAKRVRLGAHETPYADFSDPYGPRFPEDAGAIDEAALLPLPPPEVMQHDPVVTHSYQEDFYHADTRLSSSEIPQDSFDMASDVNITSAVSESSAVLEQFHGPLEQSTPKNQVPDEICFGMVCTSFARIRRMLGRTSFVGKIFN